MAKMLAAAGSEILEAALFGLEAQREKLEAQIAQVRSLLSASKRGRTSAHKLAQVAAPVTVSRMSTPLPAKRVLSAGARKRIAMAQKKRWAEFRKNKK
jgi:hypothetical protein